MYECYSKLAINFDGLLKVYKPHIVISTILLSSQNPQRKRLKYTDHSSGWNSFPACAIFI